MESERPTFAVELAADSFAPHSYAMAPIEAATLEQSKKQALEEFANAVRPSVPSLRPGREATENDDAPLGPKQNSAIASKAKE